MRASPLLLSLIVVIASGCEAVAVEPRGPGRYLEKVEVGGLERDYRLTIPKTADSSKPLPVVMAFHGWSGSAELFEIYSGWRDLAEQEGFILIAGNGLGRPQGWNMGWMDLSGRQQDEVAYAQAILDDVSKKVKIDSQRIYACGHSNGGMLTYLLASQMGDRFAAVGVVAGAMGSLSRDGVRKAIPDPKKPFPSALIIHGEKDPVVAYSYGDPATLSLVITQKEAARWYAQRAGLEGLPAETKDPDGKTMTLDWRKDGKTVRFVTVLGGNHDWFGGHIRGGKETASGYDCTAELWKFFQAHRKP